MPWSNSIISDSINLSNWRIYWAIYLLLVLIQIIALLSLIAFGSRLIYIRKKKLGEPTLIKLWGLGLAVLVLMLIPHGNILDYARDLFDTQSLLSIITTNYTVEKQVYSFRGNVRRIETQILIGEERFYIDQDLLSVDCEVVKPDIFGCGGKLIELTYLNHSRRVLALK